MHLKPLFFAHTEVGLSSTPCVKDMRREHLNISAFPVLFFTFLVKPVFDLIEKEAVITRLTKWRIDHKFLPKKQKTKKSGKNNKD